MAKGNIPADFDFENLPNYNAVLEKLNKRKDPKHLIMGNGFSMAYDHKIFSYNALYDFIEKLEDPILSKLFKVINTKNFELVMQQLDYFIVIAEAFDTDKKLTQKLKGANSKLRSSLIDAITDLHPEHVFEIAEEKSEKCAAFLNEFLEKDGKVFTTNYDLLMYWVLMRNNATKGIDGFGKEVLNPQGVKRGAEPELSDLYWGKNKDDQTVFFVHGTLPIFDTGIEIIKEVYDSEHYLLQNVKERLDKKEYPIFVTAGNGEEKLKHIMHNRYLSFCYEELTKIEGSLISFGFNFGSYDEHIIDAINKAAKQGGTPKDGRRLWSVYIGVYSKQDLDHIKEIQEKFKCKVNVYNARTAPIWN
ncbi:DUF4917 family protein [Salinimicrobium sp. WS361]|uniref:DUF4917 family protein n=1 Tax=Salinimicrobium sp. WS361 TaxID=3425123 RepID=UPI003D6E4CEB